MAPNQRRNATLQPQDDKGRFVPLTCPDVNCSGMLRHEGDGLWRCDGLVDPNDENKELEACNFIHRQGATYQKGYCDASLIGGVAMVLTAVIPLGIIIYEIFHAILH